MGEPSHAGGLLALAFVERQVEPRERLLVLGYPPLLEGAQPAGCTAELRRELGVGTLGDCVASRSAGCLTAGACRDHRGGATAERRQRWGAGTLTCSAVGSRAPIRFDHDS